MLSIPSVALLVQGFFSRRIWVLADGNELYYIPVLSLIGVVSHFCSLFFLPCSDVLCRQPLDHVLPHGMPESSQPNSIMFPKHLCLIPKSQCIVSCNMRYLYLLYNRSGMARWQRSMRCNDYHHLSMAGKLHSHALIPPRLTFSQLSRRRNQGFRTVNYAVHRAIRMAIETGALTTIVTSANLGLYLNSSLTNWYFLLGMWVAKL
jgi:hypothetical protein